MTQKDSYCEGLDYKTRLVVDKRIPWSIRKQVLKELLEHPDDFYLLMIQGMQKRGWTLEFNREEVTATWRMTKYRSYYKEE